MTTPNNLIPFEWISVEKQLPPTNDFYVCWCSSATKGETGLIHYHKDTGWQNGFYNHVVTHWVKINPPIQFPLTERWQNVYKGDEDFDGSPRWESKEEADEANRMNRTRTHYLKTYWNSDGTINDQHQPKLIKIDND